MSHLPLQLLARLASGILPDRGNAAPAGRPPLEAQGFPDLLARARTGELTTALPVEVPTAFDVHLTDAQSAALSKAVDAAAATGATRLLAAVDSTVLTVDVTSRTVIDSCDAAEGVLTDFDAVVFLPSSEAVDEVVGAASGAALPDGIRNVSLQSLLAALNEGEQPSPRG